MHLMIIHVKLKHFLSMKQTSVALLNAFLLVLKNENCNYNKDLNYLKGPKITFVLYPTLIYF
jgi:hypothetical protein